MEVDHTGQDVKSLEHSTLKVPYEIPNKKFRVAQKVLDREVAHGIQAGSDIDELLSSVTRTSISSSMSRSSNSSGKKSKKSSKRSLDHDDSTIVTNVTGAPTSSIVAAGAPSSVTSSAINTAADTEEMMDGSTTSEGESNIVKEDSVTSGSEDDDDDTSTNMDHNAWSVRSISQISKPSSVRSRSRSRISTRRSTNPSPSTNNEGVMTLMMLKTGTLGLVWSVGNGESSSPSSQKMRRGIINADLEDVCDIIKRVWCQVLIGYSPDPSISQDQRTNIKLIHFGILLKGIAATLNSQLLDFKKNITAEFEVLRRPANINTNHDHDSSNKLKQPKKAKHRESLAKVTTDAAFASGREISPNGLPAPRIDSQELVEENISMVEEIADHHAGNSKKKSRKRREKKLRENDVLNMLEQHRSALEQHGGDFLITGHGDELPNIPIAANNFESCGFGEVRFDDIMTEDGHPVNTARREQGELEHSPSPVTRKRGAKDQAPGAPRKRLRTQSTDSDPNANEESLALGSIEVSQVSDGRKNARKLLFSKKTSFTLKDLQKNQQGGPNPDELRARALQNRVKFPSMPNRFLTGLKFIDDCGRTISSGQLKNLISGNIPTPNRIAKHKHKAQLPQTNALLNTNVDVNNEGRGNLQNDAGGVDVNYEEVRTTIIGPEVAANLPDETSFMVPIQAEPYIHSIDEQNIDFPPPPEVLELQRPKKTLMEIIGVDPSRRKVSQAFTILLKLQGRLKVNLTQDAPFGPITIEQL